MPILVTITPRVGSQDLLCGSLCPEGQRGPAGLLLMPQTRVRSHVPAFTRVDEPVCTGGWGPGNCGAARVSWGVRLRAGDTCVHVSTLPGLAPQPAGSSGHTAAALEGGSGSSALLPGEAARPRWAAGPEHRAGRGRGASCPAAVAASAGRSAPREGAAWRVPPNPASSGAFPDLWPRLPPARSLRAAFQGQAPAWLAVPLRLALWAASLLPRKPGARLGMLPKFSLPQEQSRTPRWAEFAWAHTWHLEGCSWP